MSTHDDDLAEGYSARGEGLPGYYAQLPSGRVVTVEEVNAAEYKWVARHAGLYAGGDTRKAAVAALAEQARL